MKVLVETDRVLRAVFIDRVTINGPTGQPVGASGTNRLVYLVAPVRDPSGATVQLVIGGDDVGLLSLKHSEFRCGFRRQLCDGRIDRCRAGA